MINRMKNGFLKAACLMVAVMMLAACVISGTLAKYTSSGTVSKLTLQVAKWNVTVGEHSLEFGGGDIDLSSSVTWIIEPYDGVSQAPADDTIAPGTWGYLEIPIVNNSDVDAMLKIEVTDAFTSSDVSGMEFIVVVGDSAPSSAFDVDDITSGGYEGELAIGESINLYICFRWPFDGDDENDTDAAETYGSNELTLTGSLTITATQAQTAA